MTDFKGHVEFENDINRRVIPAFESALDEALIDGAYALIDVIAEKTPQPQRDTGYMSDAYSIYLGGKEVYTNPAEPKKPSATARLNPSPTGMRKFEARVYYEAPYAEAQHKGYIIRNDKKYYLNPRMPGTGPGWLDKASKGNNADRVQSIIADRLNRIR